jgi:integrase
MSKESQKQTEFANVAECLYRNKSSSTYYALVKRNGRQIRKSLKTQYRKLADLRVKDKAILIPSREEFQILCETLAKGDSRYIEALILVKLLALSGMRLTEATSITWVEINFNKGIFVVTGGTTGTKNRLVRHVPLFPGLKNFLNELKQDQEYERDQNLISIKSAKNVIKTCCRIADIPTFSHHCLRHYFVSKAIEKGIDFKTIANWIGHKDDGLLVAKTYGHLRDTHSMEMAKLMD